jgi:DNA-binding GntR family transcriptional regulator
MQISQRDRAYNYIRARVIDGSISPGSRLSNRALANEIGISFIPVREAISQLVSEGLVVHEPKLGCFVKEINRQELVDLYELREALEGHGAMVAAARITEEQLEELQTHNSAMQALADRAVKEDIMKVDPRREMWRAADTRFHLTILKVAGNRLVVKTVNDLRVLSQVFNHYNQFPKPDLMQKTCEEHQEIIEALRARNGNLAKDLTVQHIRLASDRLIKKFDYNMIQIEGQTTSDNDNMTTPTKISGVGSRRREKLASKSKVVKKK